MPTASTSEEVTMESESTEPTLKQITLFRTAAANVFTNNAFVFERAAHDDVGGFREDLTHIANHQSCEAVAHTARHASVFRLGPDAYHDFACSEADLPPATTALMTTAANMQCAVVARAAHAELAVHVAATAGVLGNATRAGDPAGWHERPDGSERVRQAAAKPPGSP